MRSTGTAERHSLDYQNMTFLTRKKGIGVARRPARGVCLSALVLAIPGAALWAVGSARATAAIQQNPENAALSDEPQTPASFEIRPFSEATVVREGRTRVIALGLASPTDRDLTIEAESSDPATVAVMRPFEALGGHDIGFLRIRGITPGEAMLRVGTAQVRVRVVPGSNRELFRESAPRILMPVAGSTVWGRFGVGVEVFDDPLEERRPVVLRVGNRVIQPTSESPPSMGPFRRVVFHIDADALPAGVVTLRAETETGQSPALAVRVVRPESLRVIEAEDDHDIRPPERFGRAGRRAIGRSDDASGGGFVNSAAAYPPVTVPFDAPRDGLYQVFMRASGDMAGGSLPMVTLFVDDEDYPRTSVQLASERWHRLPVGAPVRLGAGRHALTLFFANDFYVPARADRNLRLDLIEIAPVPDPPLQIASLGRTQDDLTNARRGAMEMAMMGASLAGSPENQDVMGLRGAPLRVAFDRVLDGRTIAGQIEIKGLVYAEGAGESPDPMRTPVVSLIINGREVASQRSLSPRYWVDASAFQVGANEVQMVARLDGAVEARTPVQTLYRREIADGWEGPARQMYRFSIRDARWDEQTRRRLSARTWPSEHLTCAFMSEGTATLHLPEDLEGRFEVYLEAFGEGYEGQPIARVEIARGEEINAIGETEIASWWQTARVGEVDLEGGAKDLRVSFINDRYTPNVGDRNLLLQAVILREVVEVADQTPPSVEIVHPRANEGLFGSDVVVARVFDDVGSAWAEVLLDGQPTGIRSTRTGRDAEVVLPMTLRGVLAGEHTIAIRARDEAGNQIDSPAVKVRVLSTMPREGTRFARSVHVLNRFGWGPDPRSLAAILEQGTRAWLSDQLRTPFDDPRELAALGPALVRFPTARSAYEVPRRAVHQAMRTALPAREHLVLWVENHFSTWVRKTEGDRKWGEHIRFSELGAARFHDLLLASATSPAMLRYLDQDTSFAGQINENYAREVMELHTLGVDRGYTQTDVTRLAHLLAGWSQTLEGDPRAGGLARQFQFTFDPRLNDGSEAVIVGARFEACEPQMRFDRIRRVLETLSAHPNTAEFIARKLCEHYVSVPAPTGLTEEVTRVYHKSGGDLLAMILAIHDSREFWSAPPRVCTPLDYALRLARLTEDDDNPWRIAAFLQRSGMQLFDRSTPDGYPEEDDAYLDTNAMIQRWALAREVQWVLASRVPDPIRYAQEGSIEGRDQLVVDLLAIQLTGGLLHGASNDAALEYLAGVRGQPAQRVLALAPFIAQLPEANLR